MSYPIKYSGKNKFSDETKEKLKFLRKELCEIFTSQSEFDSSHFAKMTNDISNLCDFPPPVNYRILNTTILKQKILKKDNNDKIYASVKELEKINVWVTCDQVAERTRLNRNTVYPHLRRLVNAERLEFKVQRPGWNRPRMNFYRTHEDNDETDD